MALARKATIKINLLTLGVNIMRLKRATTINAQIERGTNGRIGIWQSMHLPKDSDRMHQSMRADTLRRDTSTRTTATPTEIMLQKKP